MLIYDSSRLYLLFWGVFSPGGGGNFPRKSKNLPAPGNPKWGPTPRENSPGGGGEFLVFGGDQMGSPYFSSFDYSPPSGGNLMGTWWGAFLFG